MTLSSVTLNLVTCRYLALGLLHHWNLYLQSSFALNFLVCHLLDAQMTVRHLSKGIFPT